MSKLDLAKANTALKSREKRTHQNVAPLKGVVELKRATVKLEKTAKALQRQLDELKASNKASAPAKKVAAPAKKALASRTVVVDGETVTLGPGEEICRLVNPKAKKKIVG
jgi:hypothetical protein